MSLGSIYEEQGGGTKGRDLRWELELPASAVGAAAGVRAEIPDRLPVKDAPERAPRTVQPQDPKGAILLHLPESFVSGSALRLRGYGEARSGGRSGDLYLVVKLGEAPPSTALVRLNQSLVKHDGSGPSPLGWTLVAIVSAVLASLFVL